MIEFKTKPFTPNFTVDDWEELNNLNLRLLSDFEFTYCDYKIGDEVYTKLTPEFMEAFKKVKMWELLSK